LLQQQPFVLPERFYLFIQLPSMFWQLYARSCQIGFPAFQHRIISMRVSIVSPPPRRRGSGGRAGRSGADGIDPRMVRRAVGAVRAAALDNATPRHHQMQP
jgi:hypothetical protein